MSDLLMLEHGDGGELALQNNDLVLDNTFYTAVYLALFEGKNYYNILKNDDDVNLNDEDFETALNCVINRKNLGHIESLANSLLNWMISEGLAQSIETQATGVDDGVTKVNITITEPDGNVGTYSILWDREKMLLKKFEVIYGGVY